MNTTVVIIMIICATVIALVAIICDHLFERKSSETSENLMSKKIVKIHRNYIAGFLGFAIIMLLTAQYGGPDNAIFEYLSFGSTITSLVLSILAIFVTVQSSSDLYKQFTRIDNATDTIKKVSTQIDSTLSVLQNAESGLQITSQGISAQLDNIVNQIDERLQTRMRETEKNISDQLIRQNIQQQNVTDKKATKNKGLDKNVFLEKMPYNGMLTLYACTKAYETHRKFELQEFFKGNEWYHVGIFMASVAAGYLEGDIHGKAEDEHWVKCDMSVYSSEEISKVIKEQAPNYNAKAINDINKIDDYFSCKQR